ncbi:sulfatase [Paenibacillus sp. WQ 127069]|uniref:Sulfatase n=1 Tax=Paenibacillus baimaensis TaxID=2982185 RepID=A0ABT2UKA8_9BACL|nr:sulfatase [Paenibacillus sp. WQ 127069]MCU6795078.1 sulfatase [Paenibacillus sp. WQ 127069]
MKAIMVMFDSLNRHMLPAYGCDWIHAPNFKRLAQQTAVFDNAYVGSMPCMPARRELQTGRYNFLHRSWGPLEPYDDSVAELLRNNGVYTHLVTDHQHYWEDGGCTYHNRYHSYELIRGQEGDPWKGQVKDPEHPDMLGGHRAGNLIRQDWVNRQYIREEAEYPQAKTFAAGMEFIRTNADQNNWFLQLETFDPHEPFRAPENYRALYPHDNEGKHFDWPPYSRVTQTPEEVAHLRYEYAALLSMCDAYLGKVLDMMDELNLWEDTLLIVNTDHGFLLGEHDWWAKMVQPFYNEVSRMPLFIWDPRSRIQGVRRSSLVQTIDLAPTLLEFFGAAIPEGMQGKPLKETIASDQSVREAALFGIHGGHVNCTDGRYVYMRAPATATNEPLYNYTLMPTHMRTMFSLEELRAATLAEPFAFTKGVKPLKTQANSQVQYHSFGTLLFDQLHDPQQNQPLENAAVEQLMIDHMIRMMKDNDAPIEQFQRLGLV